MLRGTDLVPPYIGYRLVRSSGAPKEHPLHCHYTVALLPPGPEVHGHCQDAPRVLRFPRHAENQPHRQRALHAYSVNLVRPPGVSQPTQGRRHG